MYHASKLPGLRSLVCVAPPLDSAPPLAVLGSTKGREQLVHDARRTPLGTGTTSSACLPDAVSLTKSETYATPPLVCPVKGSPYVHAVASERPRPPRSPSTASRKHASRYLHGGGPFTKRTRGGEALRADGCVVPCAFSRTRSRLSTSAPQVSPTPHFFHGWRRVAACAQEHRVSYDDAADPAGCRTATCGCTRHSGGAGQTGLTPAGCVFTRPPGGARPGVAITRSSCVAQVSAPP